MSEIKLERFSKLDKKYLGMIEKEYLEKYIEFLTKYNKVKFKLEGDDKLYDHDKLPKGHGQALPDYPITFRQFGMYFEALEGERINLMREGFFDHKKVVYLTLGTMYSPSLIVSVISDAYSRDRFCDGLFAFGVKNHLYLKMLLHLLDCKNLYDKEKLISKNT